jgi:hypothetical protein
MTSLYNETAPQFASSGGRSNLTAFFGSRGDAEKAVSRLEAAGIGHDAIALMPGYEADSETSNVESDDRGGFWAALSGWFFPDDDRHLYAEGLRRGGFLISVQVDDANHDTAHDILDDEGSIDIDERADIWRSEGWEMSRSNEELAQRQYDSNQFASPSTDAGSEADAAVGTNATPNMRRTAASKVRSYDIDEALPDDQSLRDDILPTGHQSTVDSDILSEERDREGLKDPMDVSQIQTNGFPR